MNFISFTQEISELVKLIVSHPVSHGRWINTLSYLENCGARKIASCEHPTLVKEEMLKHASEEFRHAFYLKKQLVRLGQTYEDYRLEYLLGGWASYHYLNALDLQIMRFIRQKKELAYFLVTYAIELRAAELYPLYQSALRKAGSKVQVQSILLEEKEHLAEMEKNLCDQPSLYIQEACRLEALLFKNWLDSVGNDLKELRSPMIQ